MGPVKDLMIADALRCDLPKITLPFTWEVEGELRMSAHTARSENMTVVYASVERKTQTLRRFLMATIKYECLVWNKSVEFEARHVTSNCTEFINKGKTCFCCCR